MIAVWLTRALAFVFALLPVRLVRAVGAGLSRFVGSLHRSRRKTALDALARSLPELDESDRERVITDVYRNFGATLAEMVRSAHTDDLECFGDAGFPAEEAFRSALAEGKGLVAVTGHLGNFELCGAWVSRHLDVPVTALAKDLGEGAVDRFWRAHRERVGIPSIPAYGSMRQAIRILKRGEIIAFPLDQNMRRNRGVFVDFFGRPACTSPGAAYLSAVSGAPVVVAYDVRDGLHGHAVHANALIPAPPDRKEATIREYTQRYTKALEDAIRADPGQWLWTHRRWKTRPPEEDAPTAPPAPGA